MINNLSKLKNRIPGGYILYLFLVICIYLLLFEEPLNARTGYAVSLFRNLLTIPAVIVFVRSIPDDAQIRKVLINPFIICGVIFAVSGLAGYFIHHYISFSLTVHGLYEHIRVWLCIYLFYMAGKKLSFDKYSLRLYIHTFILSVLIIGLSLLDLIIHRWPRQDYRHGIGSIQLFFGHPSNLAAKAVFLAAMLCLLVPFVAGRYKNTKKRYFTSLPLVIILITGNLLVSVMTLRIRVIGFAVIFVILMVYMIALKRRLHIPVIIIAGCAAVFVGKNRLYNFYLSAYARSIARGKLFYTALDIARTGLPFGSGFGTFGSRIAQVRYSPLYYKYELMNTIGLMPNHPNYACDSFIACIIAESGWLGSIAYAGLIISLTVYILIAHYRAPKGDLTYVWPVFTALMLIVFELFEMLGTLSFSEIYSALIAIPLGLALSRLFKQNPPLQDRRSEGS